MEGRRRRRRGGRNGEVRREPDRPSSSLKVQVLREGREGMGPTENALRESLIDELRDLRSPKEIEADQDRRRPKS